MERYIVLLKFTEKGRRAIEDSPSRARRFCETAETQGAKIESVVWTLGEFDGVLQLSAPDEVTAMALILSLAKAGNVDTRMLRAFDSDEFSAILKKVPT